MNERTDRIDFGDQPWSAIPRDTLRDQRLSPKAKGGLVTLLSHDEGWVRSCIQMLQQENTCGREQAQAIMRELVQFGYAKLETVSDGGKVRKYYTVFAVPNVGNPMDGKPDGQETRSTGPPSVVVEPLDEEPLDEEDLKAGTADSKIENPEPSDEDFLNDFLPAPNPSDRQVYLVGRLIDHDERWSAVTFGGIVGLNKTFGREVVTEALGYVHEEAQGGSPTPKSPFPLVRSICQRIASEVSASA